MKNTRTKKIPCLLLTLVMVLSMVSVCFAASEDSIPMYRLYNPYSGEHFYTGSAEECEILVDEGWNYEGVAWNAPRYTGEPVYRLYNPYAGEHHYTMSIEERENLVADGWNYEGIAWNSPSGGAEQYRLYNPYEYANNHHYTGSTEERDWLVSLGWKYEGIGWYGVVGGDGDQGTTTTPTVPPTLNCTSVSLQTGETATLNVSNATGSVAWSSSDTSVATVKDGTVTAVSAGTATITASVDGLKLTCDVTVTAAPITVTPTLNRTSLTLYIGQTATLSVLNATGSVSWSSTINQVASVNNGVVTATGAGSATVAARVNDQTLLCNVTVTGDPSLVKLDCTSLNLNPGKTAALSVSNATGSVAWSSSDTSVATVKNGTVTAVSAGTATITASVDGLKLTCTVTVTSNIKLNSTSLSLQPGEVGVLLVTNTGYGAVSWSSSNTAVATVDSFGWVFGVGIGTATITASVDGLKLTCDVTVTGDPSLVKLDCTSLNLNPGKTAALSVSNATGSVAWSSSDTSVATVKNGTVTAVSVGTATITASVDGLKLTCDVTVTNTKLNSTSLSLQPGETATLNVSNAAGSVAWSSSDTSVATVKDGTVTAVDGGTATITASVDGLKLTCTVKIVIDKAELNAAIAEADAYLAPAYNTAYNQSAVWMRYFYKTETWNALTDAASNAETIAANETAKTSEITQAISDLRAAINGLEKYTYEDGELVYYPEISRQILEDINDYREENGLNRLEWSENYTNNCRIQASYNAMTCLLNYDAFMSTTWRAAVHTGAQNGTAFYPTWALEKAAGNVLSNFQNSPGHNAYLLRDLAGVKYGGVAFCSYTLNGRTVYVCIWMNGSVNGYNENYNPVDKNTPIENFCTIEEVLNCTEK